MRLDRGERVLLDVDVHDDALQTLLGQHAEAEVDGLGDPHAPLQVDVRLDAVVELVDVDLEAGDEVGADDLVAVDLEMGDVVAGDVPAEVAEAGQQLARGLDLLWRRAHVTAPAISSASGWFAWSHGMQWSPK